MTAIIIPFPIRRSVIDIQAAKGGFEITLTGLNGRRTHLGTSPNLNAAKNVATTEAFRVGRCKVRILAVEGRI